MTSCPECEDTGMRDSGGTHPWGEAILVPCDCDKTHELFRRICEGLPVEPLVDFLAEHPHWWDEVTMRQDFLGSAHHATKTIHLRGPEDWSYEAVFLERTSVDYPGLPVIIERLMPVIEPLLKAIEWKELGRVMIVKLPGTSMIEPHSDQGAYAEHFARFHVPLTTNKACALTVEGQPQFMAAGEAWWFNHRRHHYAHNGGLTDRLHLIVDAVSPLFPVADM